MSDTKNAAHEAVIDPSRRIVDPHHHLWNRPGLGVYMLDELWADTGAGHAVEKTVFIECRAFYREDGPVELQPVGETEAIAKIAEASRAGGPSRAVISGIVAHANLTLEEPLLRDVIAAHREVDRGLLRGFRHAGARDPQPEALSIPGRGLPDQYDREDFRRGVRLLGKLGLSYDSWHYHFQNPAYAALARAVPDTVFVLDHFGTPLGVGRFAGKRDEIFEQWKLDIAEIARCPNIVAKLGGLAMPDNGFGWDGSATSAELVEAQKRYYMHTIECFGVERCMFESNFPVDKRSIGYVAVWNAFKLMVSGFSESEKHALFYANAERVYRL
ncbi:MAG TPA: amidohydrolase family protein [Polyangiales bacterium]|nr:amidohydrolase family protein [Polyangiales bacterium]